MPWAKYRDDRHKLRETGRRAGAKSCRFSPLRLRPNGECSVSDHFSIDPAYFFFLAAFFFAEGCFATDEDFFAVFFPAFFPIPTMFLALVTMFDADFLAVLGSLVTDVGSAFEIVGALAPTIPPVTAPTAAPTGPTIAPAAAPAAAPLTNPTAEKLDFFAAFFFAMTLLPKSKLNVRGNCAH